MLCCRILSYFKKRQLQCTPPAREFSISLVGVLLLRSVSFSIILHQDFDGFDDRQSRGSGSRFTLSWPMFDEFCARLHRQTSLSRHVTVAEVPAVFNTARCRCKFAVSVHLASSEAADICRLVGICYRSKTVSAPGLPVPVVRDAASVAAFTSAMREARSIFAFIGCVIIIVAVGRRRYIVARCPSVAVRLTLAELTDEGPATVGRRVPTAALGQAILPLSVVIAEVSFVPMGFGHAIDWRPHARWSKCSWLESNGRCLHDRGSVFLLSPNLIYLPRSLGSNFVKRSMGGPNVGDLLEYFAAVAFVSFALDWTAIRIILASV